MADIRKAFLAKVSEMRRQERRRQAVIRLANLAETHHKPLARQAARKMLAAYYNGPEIDRFQRRPPMKVVQVD